MGTAAWAVTPGAELYLVSAGRGQGACVGGICSQWRTDLWLFNPPTSSPGTVRIELLRRDRENLAPSFAEVSLASGQTLELRDVIGETLGLDGLFGALRVVAHHPVVVTGRVYDDNVVTNKGAGTAGQFYAGMSAAAALGLGDSTDILGLAHSDIWRSNLALVETSGAPVTVQVQRLDGGGTALGSMSVTLRAREAKQINNVLPALGAGTVTNQRVRVSVTEGSGRVLTAGSIIDNRTGDPSTVEMTIPVGAEAGNGVFEGVVRSPDGVWLDGGMALYLDSGQIEDVEFYINVDCDDAGLIPVDLFPSPPLQPIPLGPDGSFELSFSQEVPGWFTVTVTMTGTRSVAGPFFGALQTAVSGATGDLASCNATTVRPWRAAWTASY